MAAGLVALTLLLLAPLGSAGVQRTRAGTGADAAALAAAQAWIDRLTALAASAPVPPPVAGVAVPGAPGGGGPGGGGPGGGGPGGGVLRGAWIAAAEEAAARFAASNGSELTGFSVSSAAAGPEFAVTVRSRTPVTGTPTRVVARATARVVLTGDLCWLPADGVGLRAGGSCAPAPGGLPPSGAVEGRAVLVV